jgi:hypothetical protein
MSPQSNGAADLSALDVLYRGADAILRASEAVVPGRAIADFTESVRWSEPFIVGLVAAQAALLAAVVLLRRSHAARAVLFALCAATVFCGRLLNDAGRAWWPAFATQDYFDSQGLFMLVFVCGPLILSANVIVVRFRALNPPCVPLGLVHLRPSDTDGLLALCVPL